MRNKEKGELVEQIVITELMKIGIPVSKTIGDNQPYDIVMEYHGNLKKVQIRTMSLNKNGSLKISLRSQRINTKKRYSVCQKEKVDYFIGYCFDNNECYIFESSKIESNTYIQIRLKKSKNNQVKKILLAENYLLKNVILFEK